MKLYKLETWVEAPDSLKPSDVAGFIISLRRDIRVGTAEKKAPNEYLVPAPKTKLAYMATKLSTT